MFSSKSKKAEPEAPVHTGMLNAFMGKFSEEQRQDLAGRLAVFNTIV
jgi:hypothetical protein